MFLEKVVLLFRLCQSCANNSNANLRRIKNSIQMLPHPCISRKYTVWEKINTIAIPNMLCLVPSKRRSLDMELLDKRSNCRELFRFRCSSEVAGCVCDD